VIAKRWRASEPRIAKPISIKLTEGEKQLGQAGNDDGRPERKGVASTARVLRNDPRPKSQ
jgi:hypothetical protein